MTLKCPACSAVIQADDAYAGQEGECPTCGADIHIPHLAPAPIHPPYIPPTAPTTRTPRPADNLLRAGWICFGIGAAIMPFLLIVPIWGPLFGAACLLAIIAIVKGRVGAGLSLLLCTLIAPFIIAGLVLLMGLGAAATIATARFPPHTTPVARPTTAPTASETITLDTFLSAMSADTQNYTGAQTTVRKDEAKRQAENHAAQLCRDLALTFRAVIRDVRAPQPGVTRLEYTVVSPSQPTSGPRPKISTTGYVELNLSREKALKIVPGQTIQLTGRAVFMPGSGILPGLNRAAQIDLQFPNDIFPFGRLVLKDYRCSIVPANP